MAVKASAEMTLVDITDAYSVMLSSETYTFVGDTAGAPAGLSCSTDVTAFCGTELCKKIKIGTVTCPTGIAATISNNETVSPTITFKTTATITAACEAMIPVTIDDITVNKYFSFAVAKTGGTGNGIASTKTTYQISESQTTKPTGTWSDTPQKTTLSKPYLWTKVEWTYTDGTKTETYSVSSTIDSLEIDGRNLILQSKDFTVGSEYWSINSGFKRSVDEKGYTIMSYSRTGATKDTWNRMIPHKFVEASEMHKGIAVSFDFMCDNLAELDRGIICALQNYDNSNTRIGWVEREQVKDGVAINCKTDSDLSDGKWSRITVLFSEAELKQINKSGYTKEDVAYSSISFQLPRNGSIHLKKIKMEYGINSTSWSQAPEDIDASVSAAAKTATNYMNFENGKGLIIGDMTASELGKNVLIAADSVNIRNGETVLATFSENLIELGKNSKTSVIKLCGGNGTITSKPTVSGGNNYSILELSSITRLHLAAPYLEMRSDSGNDIVGYINANSSSDLKQANAAMSTSIGTTSNAYVGLSSDSSSSAVTILANGSSGSNETTFSQDETTFGKRIVLANNRALRGTTTDGQTLSMVHMSSSDTIVLGYGSYTSGVGKTVLSGNGIDFLVKTAGTRYKPYYEADLEDGETDTWRVNGLVTTSKTQIVFMIPLGKPVIGNPTITVSSMNGLEIRQNGKYTHGSSSNGYVIPTSYKAALIGGNCICVTATMSDTTNAVNNETCFIRASISIEFS